MAKCHGKTKSGKPCGMGTKNGARYCFAHDPARAADRAAARKLGGFNRAIGHAGDPEAVNMHPRTIEDTFSILDYALAETVALDNGAPRNRLLVSIAAGYVDARKVGELETQLAELMRILASREH